MKQQGFIVRRGNNPKKFLFTSLVRGDFQRVMDGAGSLSVYQIAALLSDSVPPEAKFRHYHLDRGDEPPPRNVPIERKLIIGMKKIVQLRLRDLIGSGKVTKHGSGKEARYEWSEAKDNQAGQNPA